MNSRALLALLSTLNSQLSTLFAQGTAFTYQGGLTVNGSLDNANWVALQSLNLTKAAFYFSDPNWTNYSARNYRIHSP